MHVVRARVVSATLFVFLGIISVSGQGSVPSPPMNLVASVVGSTAELSWFPGAGAAPASYQVEAALSAGGPTIGSAPVATTSLTIPNVPAGTYFIRVRAVNAVGASTPSNEASLTVGVAGCGAPPTAPVNLTHAASGGVMTFSWAAGAGGCAATSYAISAGSGAGSADIGSANVGLQTSLAVAVPPGTYFLRVSAVNEWGPSGPSNEVVVSVATGCTMPGAPQAFSALASGSQVSLQWQPPVIGDPPTGYLLEAGTSLAGSELGTVPVGGLSISAPVPSGTYYLRVRAQNACGLGPASSTQILTVGCAAPNAPSTPSATVSGTSVSISWGSVGGATQYQVDLGSTPGSSNLGTQTLTATSVQLSGLAPGTYYVRARAVNACGPGASSGDGSFTIAQPQGATRVIGLTGNLAFGNVAVGQTATATFTISNTGNSTLTFSGMTCTCSVAAFSVSPASGTVPPGGSKSVTVYFTPVSATAYGGVLSVTSDATSGSNTINLSGTGSAPSTQAFHVWGGASFNQYLGFWTCTFCQEFGADSINNLFGTYGRKFSPTSMRNRFGQYGDRFASTSACNQFATAPPGVFSADGSQYYGTLTLNRFNPDAITTPGIVNWLTADVCK